MPSAPSATRHTKPHPTIGAHRPSPFSASALAYHLSLMDGFDTYSTMSPMDGIDTYSTTKASTPPSSVALLVTSTSFVARPPLAGLALASRQTRLLVAPVCNLDSPPEEKPAVVTEEQINLAARASDPFGIIRPVLYATFV